MAARPPRGERGRARGRGRGGYNRRDDRQDYNARPPPDRENNRPEPAATNNPTPQRAHYIGYRKLKELTEMPQTRDVLMHLNNTNNNFLALLDSDDLTGKPDMIEMILKLLLRCEEERIMPDVLNSVLTMFCGSQFFHKFSSMTAIAMVAEKRRDKQEQYKRILRDILELGQRLMLRIPTAAFPGVWPLTSTLHRVAPLLRTSTIIVDDATFSALKSLKETTDHFLLQSTSKTVEQGNVDDDMTPPDDFRNLSSIPRKEDIHINEAPFLRVNKETGQYNNVDHYLDVQYRLLREDFLGPLRDGIEEYLQRGQSHRRLNNVILYENVRFVKPECTSAGIVFILQLDLNTTSKIRWKSSKRLIYGSLVCISKDNFETFLVATVHERKVDMLETKGQIAVQLPDIANIQEKCNFDANYVMLETTAYFESYRHILEGLQEIGDNLAFKEQIVFCSSDVAAPTYLTRVEDVKLDFTPILPDGTPDRIKNGSKSIRALTVADWPYARFMGLDDSQYRALINAVTKRFSIIQGPPGTGKTYIGLKVAKLLLANYKIWADDGANMRPILVVCYTNHALDQFLEGILAFTDASDIVRVGGRSKSATLEACMLKTLRRNVDKRAENIRGTFQALRDNMEQLRVVEDQINLLGKRTENAQQKILPASELEEFMTGEQATYLAYDFNQGVDNMKQWLGFAGDNLRRIVRQAMEQMEEGDEDEPEIVDEPEALEEERNLDVDEEFLDIFRGQNVVHDEDDDREWGNLSRSDKQHIRNVISQYLSEPATMTEEEAARVRDVWRLDMNDRWRLYRCWVRQYLASLNDQVNENHGNYMNLIRQRNEINNEKDATIMAGAKVVGMTTTGCARYRQIMARIKPKIVIVEEAAEVFEAHIVTALSDSCEHLIMIGDHQQLRPSPAVYRLAKKFKLDVSLFERMIKNKVPFECLEIQHRMRPAISEPMRFIYPHLKDADSVGKFENIKGIASNIFYIDHGHRESEDRETRSHSNRHEAEFTVQLCRYLLQQGYEPSQITILTPYYGQLIQFKDYIQQKSVIELKEVRITVVDNFQGEENDIILLSLVRSNDDKGGKIGFLGVDNRVCVALSRARKGFFVIGNFSLLKQKSELWEKMVDLMQRNGTIGEKLLLKCQIHYQDEGNQVAKASDFDRVCEGGCSRMCEFRLTCGHTCPRQCHLYDREHIIITQGCRQPCVRSPCGIPEHTCAKRCNEECGPCRYKVEKILPRCGHTQTVTCQENLDLVRCKQACPLILPDCGHRCASGCSRPCTEVPCPVRVKKELKCGHIETVACSKPVQSVICRQPCGTSLQCLHKCSGNCSFCDGGRLHRDCTSKCERTLVCGHICKEPCTKNCPPCPENCKNRCIHSKCQKKCGEKCINCTEKCAWRCPHFACTKLCHQLCDRPRCSEPCPLQVPPRKKGKRAPQSCGHPCIGLCGEECPSLCRICDKEKVQEIFFGDEDEDDTYFVELKDCGHVVSVQGMDHWMDQTNENIAIEMKCCPRCKTEIRQHLRYGNIIKKTLSDIEKVKDKIRGDLSLNRADVEEIRRTIIKAGPLLNRTTQSAQLLHFVGLEQGDRSQMTQYPKLRDLWFHLKEFMSGEQPANKPRGVVIAMKCKAQFLTQLVDMLEQFENTVRTQGFQKTEMREYDELLEDLEKLAKHLHLKMARTGNMSPRMAFSEQQVSDIEWYITRLKQFSKFLILSTDLRRRGKTDPNMEQCLRLLKKIAPYGEKEMAEVKKCMQALEKLCNISGLGITDEERIQILRAIGLSQGHWYKCRNGHVYAIGECGGATQESRCPECGDTIGGTGHRLVSGNQVATEMDGARYSAFSDQANMDNYDQAELRRIAGLP